MDEQGLVELRAADWPEIMARVLKYGLCEARRYRWYSDSSLPEGQTVQDLVLEAISDLWANPNRINPAVPLAIQLMGIVRHKLWNLAKSSDDKVSRPGDFDQIAGGRSGTEDAKEQEETFDELVRCLAEHEKVKGKPDHELVLTAICCGATDVQEIMTETGLSRPRVYQIRRELRAIYVSLKPRIKDV